MSLRQSPGSRPRDTAASASSAQSHYKELLAERYSWMSGDFDAKVLAEQKTLEKILGSPPLARESALDLGCGSGFQTLALAQLGFRVTALDSSDRLLKELGLRAAGQPIRTVLCQLQDLSAFPTATYDVVTCMGDTLAHLGSIDEVSVLLMDARRLLKEEGRLILGFRDQTQTLQGVDRILLVRSDRQRIMTCFLEYTEDDRMLVTDVFHESALGGWKMVTGSYAKIRLRTEDLLASLQQIGFEPKTTPGPGGTTLIAATKSRDP